jgi:hypothetical protein
MMKKNVIVSINKALRLLEHYPGEVFNLDKFEVCDTDLNSVQQNSFEFRDNTKMVCVVNATGSRYPDVDLSKFDSVVVLDEEALDGDSNIYLQTLQQKFNNNHVMVVCSGYHKGYSLNHDMIYVYPYFLQKLLKYNSIPSIDSIKNYQRTFDVLLGGMRPHRRFVFEKLGQHRMLLNECFVNLTTSANSTGTQTTIFRTPELDAFETTSEIVPTLINQGFSSYVTNRRGVVISQLVPWKVYQHSLYSIVTETNFENYFFFSEKTAKPLYAGRLFVFFGAQGQLQDLKQLGFQTFDSIIDESYDAIDDTFKRFEKAFEQVIWLVAQDHQLLYKKMQPILQHNQRHIQDRQYFLDPLKQWIFDRY